MTHQEWLAQEATRTIVRLRPVLEKTLNGADNADAFMQRLKAQLPRLLDLLLNLYGDRYDFFYHLEKILVHAAQMFVSRPPDLHTLDAKRLQTPDWYLSEKMLGMVVYVDLYAGSITGLRKKIPFFKEMHITYLHLMPLFKVPETNNDGGYAISDYRIVNPALGTMAELADFATELREHGISLTLDFVFNHTSNEHHRAKKAIAGDDTYQNYYLMFPDRTLPDQYERTLREIFPEQAPGSFTYYEDIDKWVWTSFYDFQWDLNYRNPEVFNALLGEMLFLANQGVEVLRLDAVAFIWKQMGTSCENLPQAHMIIQAYNALLKIVAPAMLFKSEAIVHPDDVMSYISLEECPISYNPTMMALIWEALATRNVNLLQHSMSKRYGLPEGCVWINYVRVHDDIGWTFADEDAAQLGINGYDHRQFLNQFYIGNFEGSFATGQVFGFNAANNDMRITGTAASLAGLEQGIKLQNDLYIDMAMRRLLLMHSIILSTGGIPLIYAGDEIALLNDYSYEDDPEKAEDSRWVHRQKYDEKRAAKRHNPETLPGRLYTELLQLINIRRSHPVFAGNNTTFFHTGNEHVLGYVRGGKLLVLCNFSDDAQSVNRDVLVAYAPARQPGKDLLTNEKNNLSEQINLDALCFMWILFE